jgi:Glucose-regulated metallo-peptidase M90
MRDRIAMSADFGATRIRQSSALARYGVTGRPPLQPGHFSQAVSERDAYILAVLFGLLKEWRRHQLRAKPLPKEWLEMIRRNVRFFSRLSACDQAELVSHIQVFLAEKRFEGCGDLELTDDIRVTIEAQACLLLLHRRTDYFPHLRTILVYPSTYVGEGETARSR